MVKFVETQKNFRKTIADTLIVTHCALVILKAKESGKVSARRIAKKKGWIA